MKKQIIPKLCGGTFFTLVLNARRQRTQARNKLNKGSDGLTDMDVLIGLIKVINPAYRTPEKRDSMQSTVNKYKSCTISNSNYFPFGDYAVLEYFDKRVKTQYGAVLIQMTQFVQNFIDVGTEYGKDVKLVKALIDLLQQDTSINDDVGFYAGAHGEIIKKADLADLSKVCLPSFLLGIWHYIAINRKDNMLGKETYDEWCPYNKSSNRDYSGTMGDSISQDIKVYIPDISQYESELTGEEKNSTEDQDTENEKFEKKEGDQTSEKSNAKTSTPVTQIINNPVVIQQNGDNNNVISNSGTITINKH